MKAIVQHRYGLPEDVLALEEIDTPTVGAGDVLIRVRAAGSSRGPRPALSQLVYQRALFDRGNR